MTNRRMLLTGVALSTGLLLIGEGCIGAAPVAMAPKSEPSIATPTRSVAARNGTTMEVADEERDEASVGSPHRRARISNEEIALAASMETEDAMSTQPALAIDGDRPCRFMRAKAGNTKGPSYADVCVR